MSGQHSEKRHRPRHHRVRHHARLRMVARSRCCRRRRPVRGLPPRRVSPLALPRRVVLGTPPSLARRRAITALIARARSAAPCSQGCRGTVSGVTSDNLRSARARPPQIPQFGDGRPNRASLVLWHTRLSNRAERVRRVSPPRSDYGPCIWTVRRTVVSPRLGGGTRRHLRTPPGRRALHFWYRARAPVRRGRR